MYSLVTLVSSLAIASASICCIPPQWEGQVGFLYGMVRNGKVEYSRGSALMAYDGVRRLIGQREYIDIGSKGQTTNVDVLLDFNSDTKWIRKGSQCIKTKLNRVWEPGCIPDNATVVGRHAELGYGTNMIPVDSYRIDVGGGIQFTVSVTPVTCIPVLEDIRGSLEGVQFMQNVGYVNISAGLSDPTELISPPTGCTNAPMVEAHYTQGAFNAGMVGRRSIFGLF